MATTIINISAFLSLLAGISVADTIDFYTKDGTCPTQPDSKLDRSGWDSSNTISCGTDQGITPCHFDTFLDKGYCCGPHDPYCWTWGQQCSGSNGTASAIQRDCGGYCCISDQEICTKRSGQTNICWLSPQANPMISVTRAQSNATFSSLLRASPSATILTFDPARVATSTSTSPPTQTSAKGASNLPSSNATSPGSNGNTTSQQELQKPEMISGLSSGAVAGIVIGVIFSTIIIALGAYTLGLRRGRRTKPGQNAAELYNSRGSNTFEEKNGHIAMTEPSISEIATANPRAAEAGGKPLLEMPGEGFQIPRVPTRSRGELPGSGKRPASGPTLVE